LKRLFAILFFTWLAALLALTYWPDFPDVKVRVRKEWFRTDYIGHLGFYAVLAALFLLWRTGWRNKVSVKISLLTLGGGIVLAILTEISQVYIPGRAMNPMDLIYNCVGVLVGVSAVMVAGRR
jgi:VanZ family protein